jgi:hypothetical protein
MFYMSANLQNMCKFVGSSEKCETYFVEFVLLRSTLEKYCFACYLAVDLVMI